MQTPNFYLVLVLSLPICWAKNAELNLNTYPLAGKVVLDHCYVDDLMPSALTVDEAKETRRQLTEQGDKVGCNIRNRVSNDC